MTGNPAHRRIIFLDVDGTFADHGDVPPGHVAAVRAARSAGHRVLLCTGRPKSMLPERILAAGFDGIVASAGGYVEVDGTLLADRRFPPEIAARAVEVLHRHDAAYVLEAPDALYGPPDVRERLRAAWTARMQADPEESRHEGPLDILDGLIADADLSTVSFAKITCFDCAVPVTQLAREMGPEIAALPSSIPGLGERAGEIYVAAVDKSIGIRDVIAHLGVPREDTIAVGDGLNDLEMLEFAGIGVAIEDGDPAVIAVADRTAPPPSAEDLVTAFRDLGLIDGL
ncbi:HAD hydrolase family protein [Cellulomonas denverensis]|uniref:HAD hydrolase family protein n=1 Tax=Cellulomonas denverensis TaxID=264297 RepID=A0A7X6KXX0_9CELL|nr:HAD hydrolase family protein [Cellulomonas denverensis]NKY24034.1 HAD hydrolase family protein [Cellulomonas denverensis]GIG26555.1 haloacid dehalogenase [Cellulomonas denverensis]